MMILFLINFVTLAIPNVLTFTKWGMLFQLPVYILVFWLVKIMGYKIMPKSEEKIIKEVNKEAKSNKPFGEL
jgi:hypothetical protein